MEPNYEKFCLKLNKVQPKNYVILKTRIKPKEWEECDLESGIVDKAGPRKCFKQKCYCKGMRKTDSIEPVIVYPDDLEQTSNKARKIWFKDIIGIVHGTNEITVYSNVITTVPIEIMILCMRD